MSEQIISSRWLIIIGLIFVFVYSGFYFANHQLFNSPDETANNFFIKNLAENGTLSRPAVIEGNIGEMIVPRSMRVVNNSIVPASFLGLIILYGSFVSLFGDWFLYVVGGIVSVLGAWAYYLLIRNIWGVKIASFSFLILLLFPGWWYYSSLAFFPNVLLMTLVLWSLVALFNFITRGNVLWLMLSAVLTGLSLIVRLAAFPWLAVIWFIVGFSFMRRRNISYGKAFLWIIIVTIFLLSLYLIHVDLYGGGFDTGYVITEEIDSQERFDLSVSNFFPRTWYPQEIVLNFFDYYIYLFWFLSIPTFLGIFFWFKNFRSEGIRRRIYMFITLLVSLWLIYYYGSWQLFDNINQEISLGVSYVRYWLPVYMLSIPIALYGIIFLFEYIFSQNIDKRYAVWFLIITFALISFRLTYVQKNDSLLSIQQTLEGNQLKKGKVLNRTESEAVILTYRQDKIFFPDRAVIHSLNDQHIISNIPRLIEARPVYLYTFLSEEEVSELIVSVLKNYDGALVLVERVFDDALYKVVNVDGSEPR